MARSIGYIRVSTDKQDFQNQHHAILAYTNQKSLGKVSFVEVKISSCTHASHLATLRIGTWPADASTLGQATHRLCGQLRECDAQLS